jgi:NTE family protein
MRLTTRSLALACFLVFAAGESELAQAETPTAPGASAARPRVGLVLSGGGARGIAHIGVIRVLEEQHIPIDLITGTSMGSIIGGLYAAGYSPDEMEKVVDDIDWADSFDDAPPRAQRSFRRKEDDLDFLTNMKLGIKDGGIALPWGLVQGQKLNLILRRLFLRASNVHDFDALRVPFRAVSTDVVTGEAMVHESGDLATAIRASMSLPGVFAPVELDGKLLVDGGISNNTPVDLALAMGADVLIVVDVGTPLASREEITSAAAVVGQLTGLMVVNTTRAQLALMRPGDVLIRPDLEGVSTGDFEQGSRVAPRGEEAARERLAELSRLAVSESEHAALVAHQRTGAFVPPQIARVHVTNDSRLKDEVLETRLETRAGEPLDVPRLEADMQEIYGIDAFERVDYSLAEATDGTDLEITAKQKSWGPKYLRLGLNLEENFENTHNYNIAINYTVQPANSLGAEWRNDLSLGQTLRLFTEYWQPLDAESRWFVAPSFEFRRESFPVYSGDHQTGDFMLRETNFGIDLGRQLSNWGEVRTGLLWNLGHERPISGTTGFPADHLRTGGFYVRFATDTLDNTHFPRSGNYSRWTFGLVRESLGAKQSFEIFQGLVNQALTYRKNTVLLTAQSTVSWGGGSEVNLLSRLGGFLNLSGLDPDQLSGANSALARIMVYRQIATPGALSFTYPVYAGLSFETGNVWQDHADYLEDMILAGSVFLGMETPLGPLYFGYGYAEDGRDSLYLYLGRTF